MKPDTHPTYAPVVFRDAEAEFMFLTRSTATSTKTVEWEDGNTYPVIDVEVSSVSHPFYTGKRKLMDTGGRLGRFQAKLDAAGSEPATKKKKANVRTFTPAVDPKALAAKAARAEAKALEEAKQRKEAEEAAKREAEEAAAAKAAAEAEAAAASTDADAPVEAPADETGDAAPAEASSEEA